MTPLNQTENLKSYIPLFATNVLMNYVGEDTDELLRADNHDDTELSRSIKQNTDDGLVGTDNFRILEKYPRVADILLNKFKVAAQEFLSISPEIDYLITTSWITKTEAGYDSQYHCHKNSWYSGVYYYGEYDDDMGGIELKSPLDDLQQFLIPPTTNHLAVAPTWQLPVQKNILLFFPSYLKHRVTKNNSKKTRHSLAFNIIPLGWYGTGDSVMDTAWVENYYKNK